MAISIKMTCGSRSVNPRRQKSPARPPLFRRMASRHCWHSPSLFFVHTSPKRKRGILARASGWYVSTLSQKCISGQSGPSRSCFFRFGPPRARVARLHTAYSRGKQGLGKGFTLQRVFMARSQGGKSCPSLVQVWPKLASIVHAWPYLARIGRNWPFLSNFVVLHQSRGPPATPLGTCSQKNN